VDGCSADAACTTALIDRLVNHSEVISIEGKSYQVGLIKPSQSRHR
jgi:hypothetical protein